jgi:hypothetical protein
MKIEQKPKFQPIIITLETSQEAEAVWYAIRTVTPKSLLDRDVMTDMSNWFANVGQLGGTRT